MKAASNRRPILQNSLSAGLAILGFAALMESPKVGEAAEPASSAAAMDRVPVLYCTDLFHPHDDPDDHFDLATLYAIPQLDVKGIVLDQGRKQLERPGRIPVSQLNYLSGRSIPTAIGLSNRLASPTDPALDQAPPFQAGVKLILDTLRASPVPVAMITVGSVRDLVAAFNREPDLVRRKTARVLCFIGEASNEAFIEYNVGLDPHAYVGLMRSGLPVDWVPCFDGGLWRNGGHASFWKTTHEPLLRRAPPELVQFFVYALEREQADPRSFLAKPVDPARKARLFAGERNLWCTAIFASAAGRTVAFEGGRFGLTSAGSAAGTRSDPAGLFGFEEVKLTITDGGVVKYGAEADAQTIRRFVVWDQTRYAEGMTAVTAALLGRFPLQGR